MMKQTLTAVALTLACTTAMASPPMDRGYRTCEEAITAEFREAGVMPDRRYYFLRKEDRLVFFMNGSIWDENGERVLGRATCYTSTNGRELIEFKAEFGQFDRDGQHLVTR